MPRTAWVSALAGLVLLTAAPVAWNLAQTPDTVGDLDVVVAPVQDAAPEPPPAPELGPWGDGLTPQQPARAVEQEPVTAPVSLRLPTLGVVAPLDAVALEPDGAMEIPHDIRRVGWYELGVMPGEPTGTAVLSGHVDSREQGRGALWGLKSMDVGDQITVDHEDGRSTTWRVEARTSYLKEQLPIADIFTRFGDPRLVLITCGGDFDRSARRYSRNIVVYAAPVTDAEADADQAA